MAVLAACAQIAMPDATQGRRVYLDHCAACHGADGLGDGPAAEGLSPPPRDLTRLAAAPGGFSRAAVLSTVDGYVRQGHLPAMPAFGALLEGETVPLDTGDGRLTPTPRALAALVIYLESIQR